MSEDIFTYRMPTSELGGAANSVEFANPVDVEPQPVQYVTNTGDAIPVAQSEAVLDQAREAVDAAQPARAEIRNDQDVYRQANVYAPMIEGLRDNALGVPSRSDYDLAA